MDPASRSTFFIPLQAHLNSPRQYSSWYNNLAVLEFLLGLGADLHAMNTNKSTPMHYAAGQGHVEVSFSSCHCHAPLLPFSQASHSSQVVKVLLLHGANPNSLDIDGPPPLPPHSSP